MIGLAQSFDRAVIATKVHVRDAPISGTSTSVSAAGARMVVAMLNIYTAIARTAVGQRAFAMHAGTMNTKKDRRT